jgi:nucleotide-binding universal stress UspA family protein
MLIQAGLAEEQISIKVVDGTRSPADDILKEAESNPANTVILGRRGDSGVKDFSLGSVAKKVLDRALNTVVCIVP